MALRSESVHGFVCIPLLMGLAGCGYSPQQQKFQMAFLPPVPHAAGAGPMSAEPPAVQSGLYVNEAPSILSETRPTPPRPTPSDLLIRAAEERFQDGRKYYQAKEMERARVKFDQAIDLMLSASENPSDREGYEARLDQMVDSIHRYDLAGLGSGAGIEQAQFEKAPLEDLLQMTFPVDPKMKDKVREQVAATVSQLPLAVNDAVLGYIQHFSGRGRRTLIVGLERSGRYKPMIQRILDEEGVPQELIHLAQAESGFLPRAVSRKAAKGMWQFVQWRGREYGLNQDGYRDDRLDPEKATRAAARHLHDLYNEFGDWLLAIAAYDCGPGVIRRAVERSGYADFFELRRRGLVPQETTNYVPIILAMTIMDKNAEAYGLTEVTPAAPLVSDSMEVKFPTHLALISDLTDAPVSELLDLNPSLLRGIAPAGYMLRVPKGTANHLIAALDTVPPDRRASWRAHRVESGETLTAISRRYRANAVTIAALNGLQSEYPVVGDHLVIPASYRQGRAAAGKRHRSVAFRKSGNLAQARPRRAPITR